MMENMRLKVLRIKNKEDYWAAVRKGIGHYI
jgi:hypothetical protein